MRIPFYGIYQVNNDTLEVYHLIEGVYQPMIPNERGHYPIAPMQVELGLWRGVYLNNLQQWLRWWDLEGNLLLIGKEEALLERQEKEQESQKRQQLTKKLRSLSPEQLRDLGIEPEMLD